MAMAARRERGLFDPEAPAGSSPFDHYVYVIASDGDIEEGVTSEASSLAGVQQLGNLIVFYDDNKISIEHDTAIALGEDVSKRYEAYGWHVQTVEGGENVTALLEAVEAAKAVTDRPSFISVRTIIGYPAPTKMNSGDAHGAALGADEVAEIKKILGFDPEKNFDVDPAVIEHARQVVTRGTEARAAWQADFDAWASREPQRKELFDRLHAGEFPEAGSTHCRPTSHRERSRDPLGVRQGPRRARTGAARAVGRFRRPRRQQQHDDPRFRLLRSRVDLHEGLERAALRTHPALRCPRACDGIDPQRHRPARPDPPLRRNLPRLLRLHAARGASRGLMQTPAIYVWTHDSIGLGEDGPTHQPIEHLAALRAIPNLAVIRPADATRRRSRGRPRWRTAPARPPWR